MVNITVNSTYTPCKTMWHHEQKATEGTGWGAHLIQGDWIGIRTIQVPDTKCLLNLSIHNKLRETIT
jgi:hypothetical protein